MSGNVCVPTTSTDNLSASVERQDEEDDKYDTEDCEDTCPHHKVYDTVRPYSLVGDLGERLVEQVSHCPAHSSAIHLCENKEYQCSCLHHNYVQERIRTSG